MSFDLIKEILEEYEAGNVDFKRMHQEDIQKIKEISNQKDYIVWLTNYHLFEAVFVNDFGVDYYGFESSDLSELGFDVNAEIVHPDHFEDVHKTILFFDKNPKGVFKMPFRVKTSTGDYKWIYAQSKSISFRKNGNPHYVITVVQELDGLLDKVGIGKNNRTIDKLRKLYNKLTPREHQILDRIAKEMTSHEIAEELHIEPSTVDTHRKHIITKLNVRSSLGLVKFAILFSDNWEE